MKILMLNYEFPPLGGGAANACKYILKEMSRKGIEVDLVTSSSNKFEIERAGKSVNVYKLAVGKKSIHYWTQREILTYSWKARRFIKSLLPIRPNEGECQQISSLHPNSQPLSPASIMALKSQRINSGNGSQGIGKFFSIVKARIKTCAWKPC